MVDFVVFLGDEGVYLIISVDALEVGTWYRTYKLDLRLDRFLEIFVPPQCVLDHFSHEGQAVFKGADNSRIVAIDVGSGS